MLKSAAAAEAAAPFDADRHASPLPGEGDGEFRSWLRVWARVILPDQPTLPPRQLPKSTQGIHDALHGGFAALVSIYLAYAAPAHVTASDEVQRRELDEKGWMLLMEDAGEVAPVASEMDLAPPPAQAARDEARRARALAAYNGARVTAFSGRARALGLAPFLSAVVALAASHAADDDANGEAGGRRLPAALRRLLSEHLLSTDRPCTSRPIGRRASRLCRGRCPHRGLRRYDGELRSLFAKAVDGALEKKKSTDHAAFDGNVIKAEPKGGHHRPRSLPRGRPARAPAASRRQARHVRWHRVLLLRSLRPLRREFKAGRSGARARRTSSKASTSASPSRPAAPAAAAPSLSSRNSSASSRPVASSVRASSTPVQIGGARARWRPPRLHPRRQPRGSEGGVHGGTRRLRVRHPRRRRHQAGGARVCALLRGGGPLRGRDVGGGGGGEPDGSCRSRSSRSSICCTAARRRRRFASEGRRAAAAAPPPTAADALGGETEAELIAWAQLWEKIELRDLPGYARGRRPCTPSYIRDSRRSAPRSLTTRPTAQGSSPPMLRWRASRERRAPTANQSPCTR